MFKMLPLIGCAAFGNTSLTWHFKTSDEPSVFPHRHLGGWSPAPCMDPTGRPHSIKIQLLLPTWQAVTFCRGSRWAAGNRLESEWCFSVEDESSLTTVPLCCHFSSLPPCLVLLSILYFSSSFHSPSSLHATMHACDISLIKDQRRNMLIRIRVFLLLQFC